MRQKNEAQSILKQFFRYVVTQFTSHIKIFRSDNGGEFLSLLSFLKDNGVIFQHSCVYTPQQNGVVERKHCHILQVARTLKFHAHLPTHFWGECALTAVHIINRLPTPVLSFQTPFERLYSKSPHYHHLRVFGCLAYATNVHTSHKFDSRAMPCIFIGYPAGQKAYKLYNLSTKKVITSRDVFFHETIFPYASNKIISHCDPFPAYSHSSVPFPILDTSSFNHNLTEQPSSSQPIAPNNITPSFSIPSDLPTPNSPPPNPEPLRRSSRPHNPPKKLQDYMCSHITHAYSDPSTSLLPDLIKGTRYPLTNYVSYYRFKPAHRFFVAQIGQIAEPTNYFDVVAHPEWQAAMQSELQALQDNGT
jgi:hypothetical protein